MPILDLVLKETIRHTANGASLRRNVLEDITLSGGLVKRGEFIAYSLGDVHMNPNIYTRPDEFDPGRFAPGREEDKKQAYGYLGWGVGGFLVLLILPLVCLRMNFQDVIHA